MNKPIILSAAALLLGSTIPALAQEGPVVRHPNDKYVAEDAPAPASNWKGQPWWVPLAECAAAYGLPTEDRDNFQKFAGYAMMRVADDRGVKAEEAAALVLPWTQGRGRERAQMMSDAFGLDGVRANCDALFTQYESLP